MIKYIFLLALAAVMATCTNPGGIGHEGEARVSGYLILPEGGPAAHTQVALFHEDYDPFKDTTAPRFETTDTSGKFGFSSVASGDYTILAVNVDRRIRALISGVHVDDSNVAIPDDSMRLIGTIKVFLPSGNSKATGYMYIPGTNLSGSAESGAHFIIIDSVPSGDIPKVMYVSANGSGSTTMGTGILVSRNDTAVVGAVQWNYSRKFVLNTSASGADVAAEVQNFPVLVRLNSANFVFSQTQPTGSDIKFTKSDNTPLPYEIERWDAVAQQAEIWVKVDTVYGHDSTHFFIMYWGDLAAASESNGAAVFDTASGFLGVWHLSGSGNANAGDATLHHYDGTPTDTAPQAVPGVIGSALQFDGNANGLVMKNTGQSPLNFPRPGTYTFSAWVYVDTVYDADEFIAGKGYDQYSLRVKGKTSYPSNLFALQEYVDAPIYGAEMRLAPVVTQQWKYIVGIRDTANSYLFVDGTCVDSSGTIFYSKGNVQDSTIFSIGRCAAPYSAPANSNAYLAFKGKIDEVRIANVACTADWVKLSYMNQKEQDALVKW